MKKRFEIIILRSLAFFAITVFFKLIRKPPLKDWLIIFFFKSYMASIIDNFLVKKGYLKYPVRIFKFIDYSFLFSYLIFPIACVYYNQVTRNSNIIGILLKCIIFTLPSTVAEFYLEKYTDLIKYKKNWNANYSFVTIALTFLLVRGFIGIVRKTSNLEKKG